MISAVPHGIAAQSCSYFVSSPVLTQRLFPALGAALGVVDWCLARCPGCPACPPCSCLACSVALSCARDATTGSISTGDPPSLLWPLLLLTVIAGAAVGAGCLLGILFSPLQARRPSSEPARAPVLPQRLLEPGLAIVADKAGGAQTPSQLRARLGLDGVGLPAAARLGHC